MSEDELIRVVTDRLEQLRADIVSQIEAKKITASGRTQRSLRVERYSEGVRLIAGEGQRAPIPTLEIGRPGGKVPLNFTDIIVQWSKDKGLQWGSDRERRRIAGAVAWGKIARVGTDRHKHHEDVYSTLVQDAAQDLQTQVAESVKQFIMSYITQTIKPNF